MANVLNPDANKLSSGIAGVRRPQSGLVESAKAKLTKGWQRDDELADIEANLAGAGGAPARPLTAADVQEMLYGYARHLENEIHTHLGAVARLKELRDLEGRIVNRLEPIEQIVTEIARRVVVLEESSGNLYAIVKRLESIEQTMTEIMRRVAVLEESSGNLRETLNALDSRLAPLEQSSRPNNRGKS